MPDEIAASSPEKPLMLPDTMYYPDGVHFFLVPDPRGKTLHDIKHEMSDPTVGMAVVVEMSVSHHPKTYRKKWGFRYIWAKWSLMVEFAGPENWELVTNGAGPRTEMQVRELYELANELEFRETAHFVSQNWEQVKRKILPARKEGAQLGCYAETTQTVKNLEESEEQAVVRLKLAVAKASSPWRKRHDPETVVLQALLQRRVPADIICRFFDLDSKTCVPFLVGLQAAYDRLVSEALGSRCSAISKSYRAKKLTLEEVVDLLALDTPTAEDILRIGSICERKVKPSKRPTKKQLLDALATMESLRTGAGKEHQEPKKTRESDENQSNG